MIKAIINPTVTSTTYNILFTESIIADFRLQVKARNYKNTLHFYVFFGTDMLLSVPFLFPKSLKLHTEPEQVH